MEKISNSPKKSVSLGDTRLIPRELMAQVEALPLKDLIARDDELQLALKAARGRNLSALRRFIDNPPFKNVFFTQWRDDIREAGEMFIEEQKYGRLKYLPSKPLKTRTDEIRGWIDAANRSLATMDRQQDVDFPLTLTTPYQTTVQLCELAFLAKEGSKLQLTLNRLEKKYLSLPENIKHQATYIASLLATTENSILVKVQEQTLPDYSTLPPLDNEDLERRRKIIFMACVELRNIYRYENLDVSRNPSYAQEAVRILDTLLSQALIEFKRLATGETQSIYRILEITEALEKQTEILPTSTQYQSLRKVAKIGKSLSDLLSSLQTLRNYSAGNAPVGDTSIFTKN